MEVPISPEEAHRIVSALVSAGVPADNLLALPTPQGRWRLIQAAALLNIPQMPRLGREQLVGIVQNLVGYLGFEVILSFTNSGQVTSCTLAVRRKTITTGLFRFCWENLSQPRVVEQVWNELLRLPEVTCPWNDRELVVSPKVSD